MPTAPPDTDTPATDRPETEPADTADWIADLLAAATRPDPIILTIRGHMRANGLKTAHVADLLDIKVPTLNSWLSGRRRPLLADVRALCGAVGLTLPTPVPAEQTDPGCHLQDPGGFA